MNLGKISKSSSNASFKAKGTAYTRTSHSKPGGAGKSKQYSNFGHKKSVKSGQKAAEMKKIEYYVEQLKRVTGKTTNSVTNPAQGVKRETKRQKVSKQEPPAFKVKHRVSKRSERSNSEKQPK